VVIDCETGGLDPGRDPLLSVGGVAVHAPTASAGIVIAPQDSFHESIKAECTSGADNILIHGIGQFAQEQSEPSELVLRRFLAWVAGSPVIAFHAPFDHRFLQGACRAAGLELPKREWLDLAQLAPAIFPNSCSRSLDDWLSELGLVDSHRHNAAVDAFNTAHLLARVCAEAKNQGAHDFATYLKVAKSRRWVA
jgi:DNA polymerase-3 subunit epsilon